MKPVLCPCVCVRVCQVSKLRCAWWSQPVAVGRSVKPLQWELSAWSDYRHLPAVTNWLPRLHLLIAGKSSLGLRLSTPVWGFLCFCLQQRKPQTDCCCTILFATNVCHLLTWMREWYNGSIVALQAIDPFLPDWHSFFASASEVTTVWRYRNSIIIIIIIVRQGKYMVGKPQVR